MKKIIAVLVLSLLLQTFAVSFCAFAAEEKTYFALGDSIGTGYGLSDKTEAYPSLIAKRYGLALQNLAVDGDTSADMLNVIANSPEIKNAELITVSIGGNDLISNAKLFLCEALLKNLIKSGADAEEAKEAVSGLDFGIFFDDSEVNFDTLSEDTEAVFAELEKNLEEAMTILRCNNPDALIIISTLYNPYEGNTLMKLLGYNIGELIDEYIDRINEVYLKVQEKTENAFTIVDTAAKMNGNREYFYIMGDFHPTAAGHKLIAEEICKAYEDSRPASAIPIVTEETFSSAATAETSESTVATTYEGYEDGMVRGKDITVPIVICVLIVCAFSIYGLVKLRK